jgi:phage major head subunit gpT-like protein
MPALTPQFVFDLESRMRVIQENEYLRLSSKLWWDRCTKVLPSQSRREIITWILNTAQIEDQGDGGNIAYDTMMLQETEFSPRTAGKGLKLRRQQFEDLDGNGVQLATEWVAQMGAQHAYWPQKTVATLLRDGHLATSLAYDGKPFFATDHPVNPKKPSLGTYKNLLTGGDAAPIDVSQTADVALANLSKVFSHIASFKMPNGEDPRFLRPSGILCGPKLFPRAVQLTNARFIAQAAATGGGGADVEALITALGYGQPICADELAGYESDTTFFVICEQVTGSQLGGLVYLDREAFSIRYYTGRGGGTGVDAILDRHDELEWHSSGRNAGGYGHPFTIIKVKAA